LSRLAVFDPLLASLSEFPLNVVLTPSVLRSTPVTGLLSYYDLC
jgi:hypothetical protein